MDPAALVVGLCVRVRQQHCDSCECVRDARITSLPFAHGKHRIMLVGVGYPLRNGDVLLDTVDVDSLLPAT